jgi:hypothetical protein
MGLTSDLMYSRDDEVGQLNYSLFCIFDNTLTIE